MEQYISKTALVAEIKRLIKHSEMVADHNTQITELVSRELDALYNLISFLDTLEVKEVDLEKEYDNEFFKDPVFCKLVNRNAGISIAKHFFELGLKAQRGE